MSEAGRIGLVYGGKDWMARLIRLVTRSPIHHTVIDLGDGTCASAETDGVKRRPLADYPDIIWVDRGTEEQRTSIAWFGGNEADRDTAYNRPAFVLAGLASLGLIPRCAAKPLADWADEQGYTCSGLVDTALEAAGIDLFPGMSPVYTTPAQLANALGAKAPAEVK